jgi:hypothetical protein
LNRSLAVGILAALASPALFAQPCVSLTTPGAAYTQNFNTLASAGSSSVVPPGWAFSESGANANATYTAGTGSSNAGDTYSFGAGGSGERAFGGLQSGSLIPTIGACFTNNTGAVVNRLDIAYNGEQYRLGALGREDRIRFEYSANATSLATGTWTSVPSLDFIAPVQGPTAGPVSPPPVPISAAITSLNIPHGATFYIRWTDFNATGADDGLAVDDFSLTPFTAPLPTLSINDVSAPEGNAGSSTLIFTASLAAPAPGPVTFDIATADGTAGAPSDYIANSLTAQTIPAGQTSYSFAVTINGDSDPETNETFYVRITNLSGAAPGDLEGLGTILLDDIIPIGMIQGIGDASPFNGLAVLTRGVVTGRKSNGYFLQTPDAEVDVNPLSSEGIFVFTGGAPPPAAAAGALIEVRGTAAEFRPSADPASPTITEITSPAATVVSTGNPLPAPIPITLASLTPGGLPNQLERYEFMRVSIDSLSVVAPTEGFVNEASATAAGDGLFYGVLTGAPRPFREPGIETFEYPPPGAPCCIPIFDTNPERIRVDSDALGAPAINVASGETVSNLTGVLDFAERAYTLALDPSAPAPTVSGGPITAAPVPAPGPGQFTIASYNLQRFFDTVNDAGVSDVALTAAAFDNRLNKASLGIRNILRAPDILAVAEVENLATLQTLAARIGADAISAGEPDPAYAACLVEGNDVGGIDVGFLVKSPRVSLISCTQERKDATFTNPNTGAQSILHDRPPLVLQAAVNPPNGSPFPVTVIVNHTRSFSDVFSASAASAAFARAKRRAQAEDIAALVQARQSANPAEAIVLAGDYNAYQFSDGYVDVMGTIRGIPAPSTQVLVPSPDLVSPDLADAGDTAAPAGRYSYSFRGNAQTIDHILVNPPALARLAGLAFAHLNADFPEILRNDPSRPERLSDHDVPVACFNFPAADLSLTLTAAPALVTGETTTLAYAITNSNQDPAESLVFTATLPAALAFQSLAAPPGWTCTTPAVGASGAVNCTKPSLAPGDSETIRVVALVHCDLANGAVAALSGSVSSSSYDPVPSNNAAVLNATVTNPAPVISDVAVGQPVLWPPNGRMEEVEVSYSVTDGGCQAVSCVLSVSSNQPVNGLGDGNGAPDWEVASPVVVRLRAERAAIGNDRVYTIAVLCTDLGGASSTRTVTVTVPKSQGGK